MINKLQSISDMNKSILLFLSILCLDQGTKSLVIYCFEAFDCYNFHLTDFLSIILMINHGISFGMFNFVQGQAILITMDIVILLLVFLYAYRYCRISVQSQVESQYEPKDGKKNCKESGVKDIFKIEFFLLMIVISAGFSNMLDRILRGGVIDFIDFHISEYHFPAFNLADVAISTSLIFMLYLTIFCPGYKR